MGWFNKREDEKEEDKKFDKLPALPKLPELPPLTSHKQEFGEPIHKLPSFPTNSFGNKFSQNMIKEAVKGSPEPEDHNFPEGKKGERVFEANDFVPKPRKPQRMPKPLKPRKQEFDFKRTEEFEEPEADFEEFGKEPEFESHEETEEVSFHPSTTDGKEEPVFIRIDKFEAALKTFQKTKREIEEIEKALRDITAVREDENKELESWQNDIVKVKEQIEKVDRDVFSKIE